MTLLELIEQIRYNNKLESRHFEACMDCSYLAIQAYVGQMGAAHSLQLSLLRGANQFSIEIDPNCGKAVVVWWPYGIKGSEYRGDGWAVENPALAWLEAILRCYHAQQVDLKGGK